MPKETWETATISNNLLFQHVMQNETICKLFLEKLLGIKIKKISVVINEKQIDGKPGSKTSRLDVYVKDKSGTVYDIEMQTTKYGKDDIAKRARYYQAQLDMDSLPEGKPYSYMRKSYVIFVCTFDPFKEKRRIYTFQNRCEENNELALNDGAIKIFLNAKGTNGTADEEIINFLKYIKGEPPTGKLASGVDEEIKIVKRGEKWRLDFMTWEMELLRYGEYVAEKSEKKARNATMATVIRNMANAKKDIGDIELATGLSAKEIGALAKKHRIAL